MRPSAGFANSANVFIFQFAWRLVEDDVESGRQQAESRIWWWLILCHQCNAGQQYLRRDLRSIPSEQAATLAGLRKRDNAEKALRRTRWREQLLGGHT